jgi:hypothetical protein
MFDTFEQMIVFSSRMEKKIIIWAILKMARWNTTCFDPLLVFLNDAIGKTKVKYKILRILWQIICQDN